MNNINLIIDLKYFVKWIPVFKCEWLSQSWKTIFKRTFYDFFRKYINTFASNKLRLGGIVLKVLLIAWFYDKMCFENWWYFACIENYGWIILLLLLNRVPYLHHSAAPRDVKDGTHDSKVKCYWLFLWFNGEFVIRLKMID